MHILVLGATGFIGGQIVRAALEAGHAVRAFSRPHSNRLALQGLDVEIAVGDLASPEDLTTAMSGCQAVIHAAAYYPMTPEPRSVHLRRAHRQIRNVLHAARRAGIRRIVYTSSISTIGRIPPGRLGTEADYYWPGQMCHPYWDCKWIQEQMVLSTRGLEAITLIPSAVFGPGDIKPTTGTVLLMLARLGTRVTLSGRINVVDVRDVARAHIAALTHGQPGERYLIGGHNVTVREATAAAAQALGLAGPAIVLPHRPVRWLARLIIPALTRMGWTRAGSTVYLLESLEAGQWIDCTKAERTLGLRPRPLEKTMSDAVAWFRSHGYFERSLSSFA